MAKARTPFYPQGQLLSRLTQRADKSSANPKTTMKGVPGPWDVCEISYSKSLPGEGAQEAVTVGQRTPTSALACASLP